MRSRENSVEMEEYRDITSSPSQGHTMTPLLNVNHNDAHRHSQGQDTLRDLDVNESTRLSISGDERSQEKTGVLVNEENVASGSEHEKSTRDIINDWWLWEILSSLISLGFLIAIIVLLWKYQGKATSKWPYTITINTLISFLTTVFKATLLISVAEGISQLKWSWFQKPRALIDLDRFDSASRGPYGSLKLLWTLRGVHIPAIGAWIVLAAILIDPFTQQVIQLRTRNVMTQGVNATIPRANFYNLSGTVEWTALTSSQSSTTVALPSTLKAAIYIGIFDPDAPSKATVSGCPSGNCSFPSTGLSSYSSIGVCSKCSNVTDLVNKTCTTTSSSGTSCTYALPNGLSLPQTEDDILFGFMVSNSTTVYKNATTLGDTTSRFSNFSVISYVNNEECPNGFDSSLGSSGCNNVANSKLDPIAVECSLYACVKSYTAEVRLSTFIENVTEVDTLTESNVGIYEDYFNNHNALDLTIAGNYDGPNLEGWFMVPETCIIDGKSYSASSYRTTQNSSSDPKYVSLTYNKDPVWVWADCVYAIMPASYLAMTQYFADAFDGYAAGATFIRPSFNNDYDGVFFADGEATVAGINSTFQALAAALTDNMRTNGYGDVAMGSVWEVETYVHIAWGWLALPMALMLLSLVFLAFTIFKSRRAKIWKSSMLPLLYHGFTGRPARAETLKVMSTRAEKEKARMIH